MQPLADAHAAPQKQLGRPALTPGLVRLATTWLWLLIALAAVGGLRALIAGHPSGETSSAGGTQAVAVAGIAQLFVAAWLAAGSGQEASLRPYYGGPLHLDGVTPTARYAARSAAVRLARSRPGAWVVTVGTDELVAGDNGYVPAGMHYYRVEVVAARGSFTATGLPVEVGRSGAVAP